MSLSFNTGLIGKLIDQQMISEGQVAVLKSCQSNYTSMPLALVKEGVISAEHLLRFYETEFSVPRFDVSDLDLDLVFERDSPLRSLRTKSSKSLIESLMKRQLLKGS